MWTASLSHRELLPLAGILSCTFEKDFPSAFLPMEDFEGENALKGGNVPPAEPGGFSIPQLSQHPSTAHFISFYFLPVPIPEPGLLTSSSRPRRSLGALASLKLRSDEKTWVHQILQHSAFVLQSGWNGIFVFR